MTLFYVGAAALVLLALAFVLPALLRGRALFGAPVAASGVTVARTNNNLPILREQRDTLDAELAAGMLTPEQHRLARSELEQRVLDEESGPETRAVVGPSKRVAAVLGVALPLLACGLYLQLGRPDALHPEAAVAATPGDQQVTLKDIESMVDSLAKRLEAKPDDSEGWTMLGRSYAALQRYPEAAKAFAHAATLLPNDAQLLADYADALAVTQQSAVGEPTRLIDRALQIQPTNVKALAMAGSAAFERRDFAAAVGYWTRARKTVEPGSEIATGLERSIAEAQAAQASAPGGGAASTAAAPAPTPATADAAEPARPPATATALSGRVTLSPSLAGRVQPGDTVFIYARAAEGPRMPLAIQRHVASELPLSFTLDDSSAMSPEMRLSKFSSVIVSARISRSGQATPQPGDLQGRVGPVAPGATGLQVLIDAVTP